MEIHKRKKQEEEKKKGLEQTNQKSYFHFFCILDSGELCCKGERGFLGESTSQKSIGLHILGLDFLLFPYRSQNKSCYTV